MQEGQMLSQNQGLVDANTLDSKATTSQSTSFKNKQREVVNIKTNQPNSNKKLTAKFSLNKNSQEKVFVLNGRECQTLIALVKARQKGITALEISCWALRLAAYVFSLKRDLSLNIITTVEPHNGGNHGRYILQDNIKILEVFDPKNQGVFDA